MHRMQRSGACVLHSACLQCSQSSSSGPGHSDGDAASVRTNISVSQSSGLFYYEVKILSKGRHGYIGASSWDDWVVLLPQCPAMYLAPADPCTWLDDCARLARQASGSVCQTSSRTGCRDGRHTHTATTAMTGTPSKALARVVHMGQPTRQVGALSQHSKILAAANVLLDALGCCCCYMRSSAMNQSSMSFG